MTATAVPSAEELFETYGLATVIIPTVKPSRRTDEPDFVFPTAALKRAAIVREVAREAATGRPVLVGTSSVRESQDLADQLAGVGVHCQVLNARNDEREAELIAGAGRLGAVTISTNMAGRGTDIKLAGSGGEGEHTEEYERVIALGGLYVIGTNRHESRRVDDQLRGRAGRQGEPGTTRFFISLEDPLFERYGVRELLPREVRTGSTGRQAREAACLGDPRVLREIDRAQSIIEAQNHSIRRTLRKYTLLVELDRRRVRMLRDDALCHGRLPPEIEAACGDPRLWPLVIRAYLARLDLFWADHLVFVEEVREGIHLERFAGRDPGLDGGFAGGGAVPQRRLRQGRGGSPRPLPGSPGDPHSLLHMDVPGG
jgi:preprotein translocase subunit SecA